MMNVARYSVSGTSQRSGTEATFCVRWLVTARSITEPVAESASHHAKSRFATGAAWLAAATVATRGVREASAAQRSAKAPKSHDHALTCWRPARYGSTSTG